MRKFCVVHTTLPIFLESGGGNGRVVNEASRAARQGCRGFGFFGLAPFFEFTGLGDLVAVTSAFLCLALTLFLFSGRTFGSQIGRIVS